LVNKPYKALKKAVRMALNNNLNTKEDKMAEEEQTEEKPAEESEEEKSDDEASTEEIEEKTE